MKFGRYRHWTDEEWKAALSRRIARFESLVSVRGVPSVILEMNARLVVEAYHQGPWRAIWELTAHELWSVWNWYGWPRWEWARVHVLRRKPDQLIADAQREWDEQDALDELAKYL